MLHQFALSFGRLFPKRLARQVKELYLATILQSLALAMIIIFEPIYLWQQGLGLKGILIFYLAVYVLYVLIMPLGAKLANRFGYETSIALSTVSQAIYLLTLFLSAWSWWWLVITVVAYAGQKSLYWPAYHADFAHNSDSAEQGKELSGLSVCIALVYVLGPLLAGLLLTFFSWLWLFIIGSFILLLSNWPLLRTKEIFKPTDFSYWDTYKQVFGRQNWRRLLAYIGFGEELIVMVLWPVFIAVVLVNYAEIGAVVAASTLVMALVTLYIGKLSDEQDAGKVLRLSVLVYFLSWLGRLATRLPFSVFVVDAWSRVSKNAVIIPLMSITYRRSKLTSVMAGGVFFEMSLSVGKIVAALILLAIFSFGESWTAAWLTGAAMSLLYLLLK
ncbi:MFS transporter [Patescibacteria group bacterium]|nr:MFS transporter [Patescibacteria group bacterium]